MLDLAGVFLEAKICRMWAYVSMQDIDEYLASVRLRSDLIALKIFHLLAYLGHGMVDVSSFAEILRLDMKRLYEAEVCL